ncbi:hypothetical protein NPIL_689701 [Nephila pilipes]|uniref:Uncharacterized protein n=1 Tax=Nephila pilipes TaxID=299642 RepID=A0A8X6PR33_NEPPI|nr:hypothetical protein NPIL_689701 [Nephila pilipes]
MIENRREGFNCIRHVAPSVHSLCNCVQLVHSECTFLDHDRLLTFVLNADTEGRGVHLSIEVKEVVNKPNSFLPRVAFKCPSLHCGCKLRGQLSLCLGLCVAFLVHPPSLLYTVERFGNQNSNRIGLEYRGHEMYYANHRASAFRMGTKF